MPDKKELLPEIGTKERIEMFESEQQLYGTEIAIQNIVYQVAADILRAAGITHIKVEQS